MGAGRCLLWLRADVEAWAKGLSPRVPTGDRFPRGWHWLALSSRSLHLSSADVTRSASPHRWSFRCGELRWRVVRFISPAAQTTVRVEEMVQTCRSSTRGSSCTTSGATAKGSGVFEERGQWMTGRRIAGNVYSTLLAHSASKESELPGVGLPVSNKKLGDTQVMPVLLLAFRDGNGRRWIRWPDGKLSRLRLCRPSARKE